MGFTAPHPDSGKVKEIEYSAEDVTYVCGPTEIGGRLYCFEFDVPKPDSLKQFSRQGTYFDTFVNKDIWVGHAWGEDFLEMGFQIDAVKNYWKRLGFDYFLPGDTIGLAGFVETPIDDWGTDFTSRGELIVGTSSSISSTKTTKTSDAVKLNNYPNPFNQETTIRYSLSQSAYLSLEIINTSGQKITTLIQGEIQAGLHQIKWDGKNEAGLPLASGIYLVSLKAESLSLVQRTLLIK